MQEIITTGKDTEEAIEAALKKLNTTRENVNIEILETSNKGFLGIFGQKDAKVKVTVNSDEEETTKVTVDPSEKIEAFVIGLLDKMGIKANAEIKLNENNRINVNLVGDDMGIIIGRRGETLDAVQHIVQLYVNKEYKEFFKITVDTENYRAKREEALVNLAHGLAKKVIRTRKEVVLEPMKPYERRIIHTALQNYNKVKTHSIGEDPNRKLVVSYKYPQKNNVEE